MTQRSPSRIEWRWLVLAASALLIGFCAYLFRKPADEFLVEQPSKEVARQKAIEPRPPATTTETLSPIASDRLPPPELLAAPPPMASEEPPSVPPQVPVPVQWDDPEFQITLPSEIEREQDLLRGMVRSILETGPEALDHAVLLAASEEPSNRVAGLALYAGVRSQQEQLDLSEIGPELILGAVELSRDLFGDDASRALLQDWIHQVGAEAAGVMAHELLLQAELPYGGGSTALALMQEVNEPAAILVGLRGFVVDEALDASTRAEALLLLRDRMEFGAYQQFVRDTAERARTEGGLWAISAQRLKERIDGPPPVMSAPLTLDRAFFEAAFARPYPAMVRDLELFLRYQAEAKRLDPSPEGLVALREAVQVGRQGPLSEAEQLALQRLDQWMEDW